MTPSNPVFREHRTFARSVAEVFEALRAGGWFVDGAVDGAVWRDGAASGRILREDPPRSLTLSHERAGEQTKVFFVLVAGPEGTTLEVLHTLFASSETRDAEARVWRSRFRRLSEILG